LAQLEVQSESIVERFADHLDNSPSSLKAEGLTSAIIDALTAEHNQHCDK
jgi:hypothetical protein